jgi:hypothetical protein
MSSPPILLQVGNPFVECLNAEAWTEVVTEDYKTTGPAKPLVVRAALRSSMKEA